MSECARCRRREAERGKFATEPWENRCDWCVHLVTGDFEYLRREYPEEFDTEVGCHA